jgi:hypothetical protein
LDERVKKLSRPHPTNKVHFACFGCRKAFKQSGSSNWDPNIPQRPFACPDCRRPMARMGRYFKAPPRRAIAQWLKVELLYDYGERFESDGSDLGTKCRTLAATVRYLVDQDYAESDVRESLLRIRAVRAKAPKPA